MKKQASRSSSSEDEADDSPPEPAGKQKETVKKTTRYQCPADFVTLCQEPCSSTLTDRLQDQNTELWLIKAPVRFKPERFSGFKVPLSGLQTLKVPADGESDGRQIYSVLASNHGTSELRLLTVDRASSDAVVFGPAFSGLLSVCESYGDSSTNQAPQVIPASPAPAIPPGLKQRFQPFGSKTPTSSAKTLRPLVGKRHMEEEDNEERRKKKKKKEKRLKTQHLEQTVEVKEEPETFLQEDERSEEKRKKKKKKKDREREEEEGPEPRVKEEAVTIKLEPTDSWCDVDGSTKKKKKKKKSKTDSE